MKSLLKLFAVTLLTGAAVSGSAHAQFPSLRPSMPVPPSRSLPPVYSQPPVYSLPPGVRPVPTTPPNYSPAYPGWGSRYTPPHHPPVIDIDYKVFYRTCSRSPWQFYGKAETLREARHIERHLEAQGYQVELVEKLDRTPDR